MKGRMLQRHLIGGLDTSDRELSPFAHYGLSCIQPYAVLHDLYLSIDENKLFGAKAKKHPNSFLVPEEILRKIPEAKIRAQVGDKESMGVLGLCHRKGIGEELFIKRLLEGTGASKEGIPIVMGRYDIEHFLPE